ncbi:MAG: hypothetical protein WEB30_11790 [Cyclobacteriaceae bacterium]
MTEQLLERLKTARIVLALSVIVSLIFLVFAFIQKNEADKQREYAERSFLEAEEQRQIVVEFQLQLEKARLELAACKDE